MGKLSRFQSLSSLSSHVGLQTDRNISRCPLSLVRHRPATEIGGGSNDLSHRPPMPATHIRPLAVSPMATITTTLQWPHADSCQRPNVPLYHLHPVRHTAAACGEKNRYDSSFGALRRIASATASRVSTTASRHEKINKALAAVRPRLPLPILHKGRPRFTDRYLPHSSVG